jgi:hypothetical protein
MPAHSSNLMDLVPFKQSRRQFGVIEIGFGTSENALSGAQFESCI